jgi:hypothetical protein
MSTTSYRAVFECTKIQTDAGKKSKQTYVILKDTLLPLQRRSHASTSLFQTIPGTLYPGDTLDIVFAANPHQHTVVFTTNPRLRRYAPLWSLSQFFCVPEFFCVPVLGVWWAATSGARMRVVSVSVEVGVPVCGAIGE